MPAHPTNSREVIVEFVVVGIVSGLFRVVYVLGLPHVFAFLGTAMAVGIRPGVGSIISQPVEDPEADYTEYNADENIDKVVDAEDKS